MLFGRALFSFLVLPGVVAGLIPWLIVSSNRPEPFDGWLWPGVGLLSTGLAILLWCVRDFYVTGKGTLAPWDPPRQLIVSGPYRYVRNPMISGVIFMLAGLALLLGSTPHAAWAATFVLLNATYIPLLEEPDLAMRFGSDYAEYRNHVRRFVPRLTPWMPERSVNP